MSLKPAQMIKFLYTLLCFHLFGNVTGDLQNYNVTESVIARRADQTHLRRERTVSSVKKYTLLINNPCYLKTLEDDDDQQKY